MLQDVSSINDLEGTKRSLHLLFELNWSHRFLFRDLNDLLSKNRHLETQLQKIQIDSSSALMGLLQRLRAGGTLQMNADQVEVTTSNLMVVLNYWLSYEYVQSPRLASSPEQGKLSTARGVLQALSLLIPWLGTAERERLQEPLMCERGNTLDVTTS